MWARSAEIEASVEQSRPTWEHTVLTTHNRCLVLQGMMRLEIQILVRVCGMERPGLCTACLVRLVPVVTSARPVGHCPAGSRNTGLRSATGSSALAEHWLDTDHTFSWEDATIVEPRRNWHHHRSLEAWYIRSCQSTLNKDLGSLPSQYYCLIAGGCRGRDISPWP